MKRALTVSNIMNKKFNTMDFTGKWLNAMGEPERSGVIIMWGHSGNGKTDFAIKFAKYLTRFGKVAYNSIEEGLSRSLQLAVIRNNVEEVGDKFFILDKEPIEELKIRLRKKRTSPDIIFIDSFQHSGLRKQEYLDLKDEFSDKLFVFTSHADGRNPEGRTAKFVRYDAGIKIHVEGYKAFCKGRYGGEGSITIWEEGAERYHG